MRKKRDTLKHAVSALAYRVMLASLPSSSPCDDCADIAVVCLAALGDFIVFCSVARALHEQGKRLVLICREGIGIEAFAALTGYFEKVVPVSYNYRRRVKVIRSLRSVSANMVIVAPMGRHAFSDLCALAVSAKKRILPDTMQGCSLPGFKRSVDQKADLLVPVTAVNEQERYEQYLRGAGLYDGTIMPFTFDWAAQRKAPANRLIAVFPGAGGGEFKRWPVERFAAVAKHFREEQDCNITACGTAGERELGEQLCSMILKAVNRCGEMDIPELIRFFKEKVSLCLCNDTGSAHMSIACGVPTVVICGGWEYGRFYPNPRLPKNCRAIVPEPVCLSCIPCGDSQPRCVLYGAAPCVCSTVVSIVFQTVLKLFNIA